MKKKIVTDRTGKEIIKVTRSAWSIFLSLLKYTVVTISLAVFYYVVFAHFVSTDTEQKLREQNRTYSAMYDDMLRKEELIGNVVEGIRVKDDGIFRQLFNSNAPEIDDQGVETLLAAVDTVRDEDLVRYAAAKVSALSESACRTERNLRAVMAALDSGVVLPPMSTPLKSFSHARVGASLGERINPFYKIPVWHGGLDMIAQMGEDVVAAAPGTVSSVVRSSKGLGNVVEITHAGGYVTRYAHLESIRVAKGQRVPGGALVGKVGVSGNSFAPHLHYEVQKDGVKVDPVDHFFASTTPADYTEMLYMSANARQSMD